MIGGNYNVIEAVAPGFTFDTASCEKQGGASTGTSTGNGLEDVTITTGEITTCTFTNSGKGSLKLIKNTAGGDGTFDFTLTGTTTGTSSTATSITTTGGMGMTTSLD